MKISFDFEIPLNSALNSTVDVSIFDSYKPLISVCTPSGGVEMTVDEIKLLIAALQKAVELVEGGTL